MSDDLEQARAMLEELANQPEVELDPELEQYVDVSGTFGTMVRHPLVYSIAHHPMFNQRLNDQLAYKKAALERAWDERQWHTYIFLHERPYRCDAFVELSEELTDAEYWDLLRTVWIDSENIRQNAEVWEELLTADRECTDSLMDEDEQRAMAAMPGTFTIYQGHTTERDDGWSWTTERKTAVWFAHRFANLEQSEPVLSTAQVNKVDVLAYFASRGENEILVSPDVVMDREYEQLEHEKENAE